MSREVEIIARGVFVKDGRLLVCHNRKKTNCFLPGGHVEFNESAKESLRREIKEETGLRCSVGAFLGAVEHTFKWRGERTCEINLVFELRFRGLDPSRPAPSVEKKVEFLWVPLSKLGKTELEPFILRELLPRWVAGRKKGARWGSTYT